MGDLGEGDGVLGLSAGSEDFGDVEEGDGDGAAGLGGGAMFFAFSAGGECCLGCEEEVDD